MTRRPPATPHWIDWLMRRLLTSADVEEALGELHDLWVHVEATAGVVEADRRYLRELRRYPLRLVGGRIRRARPPEVGPALRSVARNIRGLARTPVLTSSIVLTVGLGLGGCTAIFAVADVLFFRPLPYPDADRLVWIHTESPPNRFNFSVVDFQALEAQQTRFSRVAAVQALSGTFVDEDVSERVSVWRITPGFFELLGIVPAVGRTAGSREAASGGPRTALVTAAFATTRLGVPPDDLAGALGTSIEVDDVSYEVIGVLPERSGPLGARTQVFATQQFQAPERRGPFFQIVLGRLADGVETAAAADELRAINRRIFPLWRSSYQDERATWAVVPLGELVHGNVDGLVVLLAASVGLLLLLATTNAASLLLTRVRSRRRELAVRIALGASRARVVGHLAAESALLALAGGLVGVLLAWGLAAVMPIVAGSYIPRLDEVSLGGRTLAFTALIAASSWLLFGLVSSVRGSPDAGLSGLRDGGRSATEGAPTQRVQRLLVAVQIAVAVPLLAASGLIATSMRNLQSAGPGFEVDGLLSLRVSLAAARYPDAEQRQGLWWNVEERLASLPGVLSVGVSDSRPPIEAYNYNNYDLEDRPTPVGENQPVACWISADASYLETLGVPLLEGRSLTRDDEYPDAPPVIVVDETWARRHFPGESAIGRRLREGGATSGPWTTVVGVVGDVTYAGFGGETGGTVYAPWTGLTQPFVVVRAAGDPVTLLASIRHELRALDPTAPVTDVATGEALISSSLAEPRHLTVLLIALSALALGLAVIGVYGVTAHAVQGRRGDIAVRLALGGTPRRVLGMVVRSTMAISLAGMLAGVLAARAFTPLLGGMVYRVDPRDPATLAAVVVLLAVVSLAACCLPAWRAVRSDPATVLRQD